MEKYKICFEEEIPKYIQIAKNIKKLIDNGEVCDGEKLPSIRKLSEFLGVNNDTIVNVYKKLQSEGYAFLKMGSGTYAKKRDINKRLLRDYSNTFKRISKEDYDDYVDFAEENPCAEFFPVDNFKKVINEVLDRDGVDALSYEETLGYEGLRSNISKYFWNGEIDSERILIVSGAQQGIDIISKAIVNVNDNIIVEKPTYSGALSIFKWRRANIFEVDMECGGINIDEFEKILKKNNIKCFYTMSYFQNPTGLSYSYEKKKKIIELANKYDFYIIEDDYLSEIRYDERIDYTSFKAIDEGDRVIYIKSFSKIFLPGIRIGYLVMPSKIKEQIENSKINTDISTSSLMQRALDLYIKNGYWKKYINEINIIYEKRYNFMINNFSSVLKDKVQFISPGGGFSFYLKINDLIKKSCIDLFYECKRNKVLITPGVFFYKDAANGLNYFKVGFSKTNEDKIQRGIDVINSILK
ncbi:DNA-binding transcriptional MocR family regulator [Clostridium acetobutylicum]|uniref:Transcriptional regulator of MocR family (DNA-binding HTH domain and aminotransferase domain) n=1 Tax=Clostridium acetobutylicum (strain ATCC 824 / DSM 792 / JCM 1419 / IAM 19013 / LMG 5710 / NBRC 13948 / NRRL B-527 / VKM B-1787 / 2291 / W) TaxID=272562 RepID=Q97GR9_CLOAB|nr:MULTISPECIES: PLP-dependent aminotransferase family protein [Clostridium]AAK80253.1 Transcriptional regulator of MocR family (DNA-binding HTH domain and aminotransferase domain) [Clostridium acetobutylicum ATCC 824]ADZ21349.1 Transcriptional regulator of MocR family (DNA-binding HTH domain and aminotransferase domain) [Clostridium acetobutylicum EA 2018]AEI32270.1 transcriptional regulator [Clostridium acetobutylicum DSM 1731]AWV79323.1 PLP-dependent aminotransferase family protein [Clostrid